MLRVTHKNTNAQVPVEMRDRLDRIRPQPIMKGCPRQVSELGQAERKHWRLDPLHFDIAREVHTVAPSISACAGRCRFPTATSRALLLLRLAL